MNTFAQRICVLLVLALLVFAPACSRQKPSTSGSASSDTKEPVAASLRIIWPDGTVNTFSPDALDRMEKKQVGDMRLLPLFSLCPDCAREEIQVTAADSFVKTIDSAEAGSAYLDPRAMRVVVEKASGKTFTIRDVIQIAFVKSTGTGTLVVEASGKKVELHPNQLASKAVKGLVPFSRLLELAEVSVTGIKSITLIAADDYRMELTPDQFQGGMLHLDGMRCEFPSLSSKYQIRELIRIEIR